MLNFIWAGMMLLSVITSFFTGKTADVAAAAVTGATDAVQLIIQLAGIMCFWGGLMTVAEKTGLIRVLAKLLAPLTRKLFPDLLPDSPAMNAIIMNISANMLGMSNAATPLGLRAMSELDRISGNKRATNAMCMFVTINTASVQLIPSTIIALRTAAGSSAPAEIIVPVWFASALSLLAAVISAKIFERRS
ncbi:MAG: hypothetical protein IKV89_01995 [Clostridia bacterium]|nr:hypothetical protein [Clostridia bacterium]